MTAVWPDAEDVSTGAAWETEERRRVAMDAMAREMEDFMAWVVWVCIVEVVVCCFLRREDVVVDVADDKKKNGGNPVPFYTNP